jgi:lipopolysaccharide biosynthesis glycosyltransferase
MKPVIPVFFATDNNYAPFVAITLESILENCSKDYFYHFHVLTTDLDKSYEEKLKKYESEDVKIEFISLRETLTKIKVKFHLRDYYSIETYYRFFIANMYPQYDKVLYMDCDIVVLGDIAELYNNDISNLYLAASPEEVMAEVKVFGDYVEKALDVPVAEYFNAGIMVMNLAELRKDNIEKKFFEMINRFRFRVTQDEDYLNVLCKGKTKILDLGWNKTAFKNEKFDDKNLKLIHYKINWKPWKNRNVLYEDYFWNYAKKTEFYDLIRQKLENYTDAQREKDEVAYQNLVQMAIDDMADPYNYKNMMDKEKGEQ